ncbi:MAG: response regulator transcription factor [Chloroflexi bacterium]|nr:response regulator transcription factor [Chloroflexota bacterium]
MPDTKSQPESKVIQENTDSECESLSNRESEILDQLSCGTSNKTIADSLGITINTVEKHLTNIYKKLKVKSRMEAVLRWMKR